MSTPVPPRPLSDREEQLLQRILSIDFEGAAQFKSQIPFARVVGTWGEGSPSVDLEMLPGAEKASDISGELPVAAEVHGGNGEPLGEITIWATSGYISAIEYAWYTDRRPESLPEVSSITLTT